jgi:hypothetical protein
LHKARLLIAGKPKEKTMNIYNSTIQSRPNVRVCKDENLPTPEAIKFRIDSIKRDSPILTPALMRRITALKLRLPKDPMAPLLPAIDPAMLIKKGDEEWGDR